MCLYCQFTLYNHLFILNEPGCVADTPWQRLKVTVFNSRCILVSVSELTRQPSCQPFQQCLFRLGGHVPEVFPAHRRKCPSSTFFRSWGSYPFPDSQVMTAVPETNCENSAYKIRLVGVKSLTSRKHLGSL